MKTLLTILFTFLSFQSFSQTFSDTTILKQFVRLWNVANNFKYTAWQNEEYTPTLVFYGNTIGKSKAIETKTFFFKENKSFHQEIASPILFSFYKSGVVKCSFDKKVNYGSYTKNYPAYLLFIKQKGKYKISGESDLLSDSKTGFKLALGEQVFPGSPHSNSLFILFSAVIVIIIMTYFLIKTNAFKPWISAGTKTYSNVFVANPNLREDLKKEKENEFEKYVVRLFKQKSQFTINEWRGDKYVEGIYAKSTLNPDLEINYRDSIHNIVFAVECKYRSYLLDKVTLCKEYQLMNYKSFQAKKNIPVFIILGAGGTASAPKEVFIIPLRALSRHEVSREFINFYKRQNPYIPFYLDVNTGILK